jgi:hypothetical protein
MAQESSRFDARSEAKAAIAGWAVALTVAVASAALLMVAANRSSVIDNPRWHHIQVPEAADPSDALSDQDHAAPHEPPSSGLVVSGTAEPPTS